MTGLRPLSNLRRDTRGTMAIETAVVAPVLALMAIGSFEVGTMVSRQQELQSAASEAEGIILAAAGSESETMSDEIETVIEDSLGLTDPEQFKLEQRFRCEAGTISDTVPTSEDCPSGRIFVYVHLELTDTYKPVWANYGIGDDINYKIERTVLVE